MSTLMPPSEFSPLQQAFNSFLLSMPSEQLEELVEYLHAREAHQPRNQTGRGSQAPIEHPASGGTTSNARHGSVASTSAASKSLAARRRGRDKPLRPLNSFIAFRSFYSTMFPDLTQKAKSGILRFLWQNDPFKAKWAILAKAYSKIRDEHSGSKDVTLESFLNLNAGYIGILNPSVYLQAMGWELTVDEEQQYTMARVSHTITNETDVSTNYSVNDIVNRCYDTGYVSQRGRQRRANHNNEAVMSFVAQPCQIVNERNNIQISGNNTFVNNADNENFAISVSVQEQMEHTPTPTFSDMGSAADEPSPTSVETPTRENPFRFMDNLGIELNLDLPNNNMASQGNQHNTYVPPFQRSPFDQINIPCIPAPLQAMETFDFDQFVNF